MDHRLRDAQRRHQSNPTPETRAAVLAARERLGLMSAGQIRLAAAFDAGAHFLYPEIERIHLWNLQRVSEHLQDPAPALALGRYLARALIDRYFGTPLGDSDTMHNRDLWDQWLTLSEGSTPPTQDVLEVLTRVQVTGVRHPLAPVASVIWAHQLAQRAVTDRVAEITQHGNAEQPIPAPGPWVPVTTWAAILSALMRATGRLHLTTQWLQEALVCQLLGEPLPPTEAGGPPGRA